MNDVPDRFPTAAPSPAGRLLLWRELWNVARIEERREVALPLFEGLA